MFRLDAQERIERTNYEAETANLSQFHESGLSAANFSSSDGCSGKYKVGWLGSRPENDMQWQNVWSREGGKYKMTIYYCTGQQRKFSVDVNGKFVKTFTVNNGNWDSPSSVDCEIELEPGENVVRLYNNTDWAPDMDRMTLELIEAPAAIKAAGSEEAGAETSAKTAYDIQGRPIANPDALPSGTIYIENNKKKMKPSVVGEPAI